MKRFSIGIAVALMQLSLYAQTPIGGGGVGGGIGAANVTATSASAVTSLAVTVTSLNLTSISPALVECWSGTTTQSPVTITGYTTSGSSPITTVTPSFTSTANVTCKVNSSGGAGATGATGAAGTTGATGAAGTNGTNGTNGAIATVGVNGTTETVQPRLNLIPGTNVTISAANNTGTNSTDVTVNSSGGGTPCTATALSLQYNNAGAFGCVPDFTFSTPHTLAVGASGIFDMHLMTAANLTLPGSLPTGLVTVTTSTGAMSSVAAPAGTVVGTTDAQALTNKTVDGVTPATMAFMDATSSVQTQLNAKGPGTVTQVTFPAIPSWLTASVATNTTTPAISITLTGAQTSHQVIGTCGAGTTFVPCNLVAGDLPAIPLTSGVTGILPAANGGTAVANTASLQLGTSNVNLATLGTGLVKNTTTTGALSNAIAADVYGLWSGTCSSATFLRGDGACAAPSGSGTVNSGTINDLGYYASSSTAISPLATANNGVLVTSGSGVPSISTTLPSGITLVAPVLGTPASGNASNLTNFPTLNQNTTGTAANVTGIVQVANGGNGTASPGLVAGTNVTITGSWPAQTVNASGGSAGPASALTDFIVTRTSTTLVTGTYPTGGSNVSVGSYVVNLGTTWTITLSAGAAATTTDFYVYWNPQSPSQLMVDTQAAAWTDIALSNITQGNAAVSNIPADMRLLYVLTAGTTTANLWDAFSSCSPTATTGCIDKRAIYSTTVVVPGTNLISFVSNGIKTVSVDPTSALPWTGPVDFSGASSTQSIQSGATDPATCVAGKGVFINTSSTPVVKLCTATNTWTAIGSGGGGGGGGATAITQDYPPAACTSGGAVYLNSGWSGDPTSPPSQGCYGSPTAPNLGQLNFASGASNRAFLHTVVPAGYAGGEVDLAIYTSEYAAGTRTYTVETGCVASAATDWGTVSYNAAQTLSSNGVAEAQLMTQAGLTMTGCSAGNELILRVTRTDSTTGISYFSDLSLTFPGSGGINNVSFSATPAFNLSLGMQQDITLTGSVTGSSFSGGSPGALYTFKVCQNGTGNFTFVWGAGWHAPMTIGSTASLCSIQTFTLDATGLILYANGTGITNQ